MLFRLSIKKNDIISKYVDIASFLLAVVSLFVSLALPDEPSRMAGFAIFVGTLSFLVFYKISNLIDSVEELSENGFDLEVLGTSDEAQKRYMHDIVASSEVHKSYVDVRPNGNNDSFDKAMIKSYESWLRSSSPGKWVDVTGISEFFSERYSGIKVGKGYTRSHEVFILREGSKIINFTILKKDNKKIVYFGWLPGQARSSTTVFRSTNENIIELFESYFRFLKSNSWNRIGTQNSENDSDGYILDHSKSNEEKLQVSEYLIDKKGNWVSIAYAHSDGQKSFSSYAVISIRFKGEFLSIDAAIYDKDFNYLRDFTSLSSSTFYLNNVYVSYEIKGESSRGFTGICHYLFRRDAEFGKILQGVFVDHVSGPNTTVGFESSFGFDDLKNERILNEAQKNELELCRSKLENGGSHKFKELLSGPPVDFPGR